MRGGGGWFSAGIWRAPKPRLTAPCLANNVGGGVEDGGWEALSTALEDELGESGDLCILERTGMLLCQQPTAATADFAVLTTSFEH